MKSLNLLNKILLENKRVLVRGDFDVPMKDGKILDTSRLEAMRETLDYLTLRGASVVLMGHMGRPDGRVVEELRLNPVADYFKVKGYAIKKVNFVLDPSVFSESKSLKHGEILLLENLRFDPREEANDAEFAKELSALGDVYVNECFSTSHREHASFVGIPQHLVSYSGLRLDRELENLNKVLKDPKKPIVAIVGGVKIETKLPVISSFLSIADYTIIGGRIGFSYEGDNNYKILVPVDYIGDYQDIGPKSINMFVNVIKLAQTIIWNGPMGQFEMPQFANGTQKIAQAIAESNAFSVVGGGDTIEALDKLKLKDKIGFVSMGGGAMLEFLSGKKLPGLSALSYYG